jgi:outer membrane protein OmpA-like peptidoglycan-associated protein
VFDAAFVSEDRSMAEDWYADVKKYVPNADSNVVAGIVRYCGIALQNRDSSLVSFSDPAEVGRVRENYLKKKLGLTNSDAELNQAIAAVGERMKADRTKNRVTVYYLLAEHFRKLSVFGGAETVAAAGVAAAAAATAAGAGLGSRPTDTVRPVYAAGVAAATPPRSGLMRWLPWLILLAALALLLWWFMGRPKPPPPVEAPAAATAPAVEAPAVPAPAAIPAIVPGLPQNVYFDTDSFVVSADGQKAITAALDEIKKDAGAKIAVTGYTDKTGDQKANEELAKNRAKAVRDALTAAGVPVANIEMRPPVFVEIGANAPAGDPSARRVEISKR